MIQDQTDIQMKVFIIDNPKTHPMGVFKFQFLRETAEFTHPGSFKLSQTLIRNYTIIFDNQFQANLSPPVK